jgi:integrase-like protein
MTPIAPPDSVPLVQQTTVSIAGVMRTVSRLGGVLFDLIDVVRAYDFVPGAGGGGAHFHFHEDNCNLQPESEDFSDLTRQQQQALDRFRQEYNEVRPHEALQMRTPTEVYQPSPRKFPSRVPEPEYPQSLLVRTVHAKGYFRWKHHAVFLSEVLWGESIGLLPEDGRWFTIYFAQLPLARFDSEKLQVIPWKAIPGFYKMWAGEGEPSPSAAPHPLTEQDQKVSGMRPV